MPQTGTELLRTFSSLTVSLQTSYDKDSLD